jgi:uridine kinase
MKHQAASWLFIIFLTNTKGKTRSIVFAWPIASCKIKHLTKMSNQNIDIIDTLEEVTDRSTEHSKTYNGRIANTEKNIINYPKVYLPDHASQLEQIGVKLDKLVNRQPDNKLELAIDRLEKKLDKVIMNG